MNPVEMYLLCNDCKLSLPAIQFAKRAKSINGYQPRCLSCASRRIKGWKSKKKQEKLLASGQLFLLGV